MWREVGASPNQLSNYLIEQIRREWGWSAPWWTWEHGNKEAERSGRLLSVVTFFAGSHYWSVTQLSRIRKKKKMDVCSKWDSLNHQVTGELHASDRANVAGCRAATDSWAFHPERACLPLAAPFENLTDGGLAFWKLAERGLHSNHCWRRTVVYTEMFFHGCHSFQVFVTGIQTIRLWWMMFVPLADS